MSLDIDPRAFGSPLFSWVALTTPVGIAVAFALMLGWAPGLGMRRRDAYGMGLRVVLWSILGARLLHVLDYPGYYAEVPLSSLYLWTGGLALWGALIGGAAGALWHARRRRLPLGRFADRLALAGLTVVIAGRFGGFIAGELPGTPTSLPWGVEYLNEGSQAHVPGVAVHPVALYELLLAVVALGLVLRFTIRAAPRVADAGTLRARLRQTVRRIFGERRLLPDGAGFVLAMAIYAVGRFLISFVRIAPEGLGLHQAQWVALAVLAAAGAYAWRVRPRVS